MDTGVDDGYMADLIDEVNYINIMYIVVYIV